MVARPALPRALRRPVPLLLREAPLLFAVGMLALFLLWTRVDVGGAWSSVHRKPLYLANFVMLYVMVAMGLNLVSGYVGAASIGHIALFAIGAYTEAILTSIHGWSFWPAALVGALFAVAASLPVGLILLRLSGWYFSVITLLLVVVVNDFWIQQADLTGGGAGIPGVIRGASFLTLPTLFGHQLTLKSYLYVVVGVNVLVFLLLRSLVKRSRWGKAFVAVRDVEPAARAVGVHPFMVRESTLAFSAFLAGLAGAMFAPLPGSINPDSFPIIDSIFFLIAVLAGGLGTVTGPVVGTLALFSIQQMLAEQENLRNYSYLVYGVTLLLLVIFLPEGIVGGVQRLWQRLMQRVSPPLLPLVPPHTNGPPSDAAELLSGPASGTGAGYALEAEAIGKRFGDVVALSDVSVRVRPSTVHAIIGPNGSGKTTLLNVISGFYRQESGTVRVFGRPVPRGRAYRAIRFGVARTFQTQQMLPQLTVLENVMLGGHTRGRVTMLDGMLPLPHVRSEERRLREHALALLDLVGLGRAIAGVPCGSLPYAHQRLVEIARALAGAPRILLLDEPASGLASDEVRSFAALIRRLKESGLTIVLVEHNFGLVSELADVITVLDAGTKLAEGAYDDVRNDPAVVEAYLGG